MKSYSAEDFFPRHKRVEPRFVDFSSKIKKLIDTDFIDLKGVDQFDEEISVTIF